ncbi:putative protein YyaP [Anaerolineae bacterium]|nr:putative protein YyaP [Anaerolineae bacterium]
MRNIIAGLFITLDGVVESPDKWSFDHFDEGMLEALQSHLAEQDTALLGRVTYEEWADYWPTSTDEPFASYINNVPKLVVSRTLQKTAWNNSTLLQGDLANEIARLKQQPGKNIGTAGSPTLVRSLLENNLLDRLILMVYPVIAGSGKRLFREGANLKRMRLVESKQTPTGVMILTYQPYSQA